MTIRPPEPPPRTAYKVSEVARSLGLSPAKVYLLCESGEIGSFKEGRRVLVPVDELKAYIARRMPRTA